METIEYKGLTIKLRPTDQFGWYWEVWRDKTKLADNSKQYGEDSRHLALFRAEQAADQYIDFEETETNHIPKVDPTKTIDYYRGY